MAYANFSESGGVGVATFNEPARAVPGFSGLEWSVIALARRDKLASLRQPGRIATALGALFGVGQNSRLADGRLEALRRLAVHAWHKGYALPVSEIRAFLSAGFSLEQYETLQLSVSKGRTQDRRRAA